MSGAIIIQQPNGEWARFAGNTSGGVVTPVVSGLGITLVSADYMNPLLTLTRTGNAATALNADGATWTTYAANVPRFNGSARVLLLEGGRTNLFLNSAAGVTQDVVVTAVLHALSFTGTGTITLSGASTAGPLVGTGVNNRVQLIFTPSAATLTLTVTGDVRAVNLEIITASSGGASSSWIVTAGASVARGIDVCTATLAALGIPATGACTVVFRGMVPFVSASGSQNIVQIDNGTANNRYFARFQSGGAILGQRVTGGATANMTSPGTMTSGAPFGLSMAIDGAGRFAASFNGGAANAVTGGPTSGLTTLRVGVNSIPGEPLSGECLSLRIMPFVASDAELAVLST